MVGPGLDLASLEETSLPWAGPFYILPVEHGNNSLAQSIPTKVQSSENRFSLAVFTEHKAP